MSLCHQWWYSKVAITTKIKPETYPANTTFAVTDSGYMTTDLFLRWLEIFIANIPPIRPVLLIMDGHLSHVSVGVIEVAKQNRIEMLILPPHTTHIFQPLDVSVFKPLKDNFRNEVRSRSRKYRNGIKKYDFGKVFTPAYYKGVTPGNIVAGFQKTGLWPVNKFAPDLNRKANTLTQSSSEPTPSTSFEQTPSTSELPSSTRTINEVISSFLMPSPQKQTPKTSKRITVSRCLTNDEFQKEKDRLERPKQVKINKLLKYLLYSNLTG